MWKARDWVELHGGNDSLLNWSVCETYVRWKTRDWVEGDVGHW
jgi:hypothetical protein